MLLSLSWLREFTPYEGTAQQLGDALTMLGLELEELVHPFALLENITTGHVVECVLHPDSDHLHCCKVDVGEGSLLDIVCGAPNVAAGQKVAVATIGTRMPDGLVIKKSKLRGQPSMGMICSERELGLSADHAGILVLPEQTQVGLRLIDVLPVDNDILNIAITPNRADCLSVMGLARETAMVMHLPFKRKALFLESHGDQKLTIHIENPELCNLYAGRIITNVVIAPSPAKIRYRLQACGIRPLSNVVDITNYILLECGQPLHAFDLDKISEKRIVVRKALDNEHFVTLDDQDRILTSNDLCICDGKKPIALAGVMGGKETEITDTTKHVFLESAVFHPASIRKTSRRLGLSSESSFRFERGIDQRLSLYALDMACVLLQQYAHGEVQAALSCVEPKPFVPVKIAFHPKQVSTLLGVEIDEDFSLNVLQNIGCVVRKQQDCWEVEQPSWRGDITRDADLIEEVGRVHGLNTISPQLPMVAHSLERAGRKESTFSFWSRIRHWAAGLGLNEAINYSFVGEKDLNVLNLPTEGRIAIKNPLSAEQNVLRPVLAPGLLQNVRTNLSQGAFSVRLFEVAHVFEADPTSETTVKEKGRLGVILYGLRNDPIWPHTQEDFDYTDLKGIVEHLCRTLHLPNPTFQTVTEHPYLVSCVRLICDECTLGCFGRVQPKIASEYLANKDLWLAELDMDILFTVQQAAKVQFTKLAAYPCVRRDITVIGDKTLSVEMVLTQIAKLKRPLLEDVAFVSLFEPESGEKHLSFRLTFRHADRTLKDAEVDKEREFIAKALQQTLNCRI
ncbi:MAG: phenylalanine--tRNA ligase subunit beta [Desulfovibrio sp.]|nr:phenylalanine--tRNA ligase subunit beta [Desulfovibrio sp.]